MKNQSKPCFIIFLLIFCSSYIVAQEIKEKTFIINGSINADTGNIYLNLIGDEVYYPQALRNCKAIISNGKFIFEGLIESPQAFRIQYNDTYESKPVFITPGIQAVDIDLKSPNKIPDISNSVMNEYDNYTSYFKIVNIKYEQYDTDYARIKALYSENLADSTKLRLNKKLKLLYRESDSLLLEYIKQNPSSYHSFWHLINLMNFGYDNIFDDIYSHFSDSLKSSYAGNILKSRLEKASLTGVNKPFPFFQLDSSLLKNVFANNKYTLMEFWYSRCGPCIVQFPALRQIYEQYKHSGFEIIGISTDRESDRENWLEAIKKYGLIWPQLWDKNGIQSKSYSIEAFPTNFLVDSRGIIIAKNIKPDEVDYFLKEHLK